MASCVVRVAIFPMTLLVAGCAAGAPATSAPIPLQSQEMLDGRAPEYPAAIVARSCIPPHYPADLRAAGIQGSVLLEFVIDTTGHVLANSVHVLRTSNPGFNASSVAAILSCTYTIAQTGGHKVPVRARETTSFAIDIPGARPN